MKKRVYHNPVIDDTAVHLETADELNGETSSLEIVVSA
jgi:hypothetical protein